MRSKNYCNKLFLSKLAKLIGFTFTTITHIPSVVDAQLSAEHENIRKSSEARLKEQPFRSKEARIMQEEIEIPHRNAAQDDLMPRTHVSIPETSCADNEYEFTLVLRTDFYAEETSWELLGDDLSIIVASNGMLFPSTVYTDKSCLSAGCYTYKIYDSFGDGIRIRNNNGSYKGFIDGSEIFFGGSFLDSASEAFCVGPVFLSNPVGCNVKAGHTFDLTLQIRTDDFANETFWDLRDYDDNVVDSHDATYADNQEYTYDATYPGGCYTFTIYDSWGDGFCCSLGDGEVKGTIDGEDAFKIKKFDSSYSTSFCNCGDTKTEMPSSAPTKSPTSPPTSSPTQTLCRNNEVHFDVEMMVDIERNGHDITWEVSSQTGDVVLTGGNKFHHNSRSKTFTNCLRSGCYDISFLNSAGEVIEGSGNGGISVLVDRKEKFSSFHNDKGRASFCTTDCNENEIYFEMELLTDNWGNETSWELLDSSKKIVASMPRSSYHKPNHQYSESGCFPKDCYTFYVYDKWGDGICCDYGEGKISGYVDGANIFEGGDFTKMWGWFFCA